MKSKWKFLNTHPDPQSKEPPETNLRKRDPACDQCRKAHQRCSRGKPCNYCRGKNLDCSYSTSKSKSKSKSTSKSTSKSDAHLKPNSKTNVKTSKKRKQRRKHLIIPETPIPFISFVTDIHHHHHHHHHHYNYNINHQNKDNFQFFVNMSHPNNNNNLCNYVSMKEMSHFYNAQFASQLPDEPSSSAVLRSDEIDANNDAELSPFDDLVRASSIGSSETMHDMILLLTRPSHYTNHLDLYNKKIVGDFFKRITSPYNQVPLNIGMAILTRESLPYFIMVNKTFLDQFRYSSLKEVQQIKWQDFTDTETSRKLENRRDEIMAQPESEVVFERMIDGTGLDRNGNKFPFLKQVTSLFRNTPRGYEYRASRLVLIF